MTLFPRAERAPGIAEDDIPYVASLIETRNQLGALLDAMAAGAGPLVLGQRGAPAGALLTFALFDQMRDLLSHHEARDRRAALGARLEHPAGPVATTVAALLGTEQEDTIIWWPDLAADVRGESDPLLGEILAAVCAGRLSGTGVGGGWFWFLAVTSTPGAANRHVLWRDTATGPELIAAPVISELLARAWQTGPVPHAMRGDRPEDGLYAVQDGAVQDVGVTETSRALRTRFETGQ